jgi:hypothetical protein
MPSLTVLPSSLIGARYAALPILDTRYLAAEQVRSEGELLLSDSDIDIREGAKREAGTWKAELGAHQSGR